MFQHQREGHLGGQQGHLGQGIGEAVLLVNVGNQHCIDVDHSKTSNGTELLVYPRHTPSAPNQQWRLEYVAGNKLHICSALNPNMVIDVPGSKTKSGTKVTLYEKNGGENQLWELQGNVFHSALGHDLVLAQHGGDHGSLIIETRNGHPNQSWQQVR